jgi:hypothetical protein
MVRRKKNTPVVRTGARRKPSSFSFADFEKASEVQRNDPAKFKSSPRLQAIIAEYSKPLPLAVKQQWAEAIKRILDDNDKYLSLVPEASAALESMSPRTRAEIKDRLSYHAAIEAAVPDRFRTKKIQGRRQEICGPKPWTEFFLPQN